MKKLVVFLTTIGVGLAAFSGPGPYGPRIRHAPPPPPHHHYHHHHHHSGPFWTGFGIGLAGGLLSSAIASPAPVVVQPAPQRVWIPPVYGERPIYRAGIYVGTERYVITPGYWTTTY